MKKVLLTTLAIVLLGFGSGTFAAVTVTDVTGGSEIRGIVTASDASGYAKVSWDGSEFMLEAGFTGLTAPKGDDFYEGWLVRRSPFAYVSTGELIMKDGAYHNMYSSSTNYSNYTEYVLTIEANDGNNAPAEHILEGTTTMIDADMMTKPEIIEESMTDELDMTKSQVLNKSEMMTVEMTAEAKAMMERRASIKAKIQARVPDLSKEQIMIILERIAALRVKLETLDITDAKKESYNEILDVFVEVLEGDDMMMNK